MKSVELAKKWLQAGFSVLPVKEDKRPAIPSWKNLQVKPYELSQADSAFKGRHVAVVCGFGGLYTFDFDQDKEGKAKERYRLDKEFFLPWLEEVHNLGLSVKYQVTPSGGFHVPIICPKPLGNIKLAYVEGRHNDKTNRVEHHAVIETRGNGGYFLLYDENLNPNDLPIVSEYQFERLLEAAMELSRVDEATTVQQSSAKAFKGGSRAHAANEGILGWFNKKYSLREILERNYYKEVKGKYLSPTSQSANAGIVIFKDDNNFELCVSYHSDVLGDGHAHDAFSAFKMLEHNGNFESALEAVKKEQGNSRFNFSNGGQIQIRSNEYIHSDILPSAQVSTNSEKLEKSRPGHERLFVLTPEHKSQKVSTKEIEMVDENLICAQESGICAHQNQELSTNSRLRPGQQNSDFEAFVLTKSDSTRETEHKSKQENESSLPDDFKIGDKTVSEIQREETRANGIKRWGNRERPAPVRWLVKNLLQDNAANLLGGEPGVGKSWVIVDLAVSVATGTPFLERPILEPGNVLFINFDDPTESLGRQFYDRTARGKDYDPSDLPVYYWQPEPSKPFPPSGIITPETFDYLKDEISHIKPRLIIVDAFSSAFPSLDGNKAQDVILAFEALRQLTIASGGHCCMLLVDHTPKQTVMDSKRRGISGSQQKHAKVRTAHIISSVDPSEVAGENVIQWEVFKANAAPYQEPFGILREMDAFMGWASLSLRSLPNSANKPGQSRAVKAALTYIQSLGGAPVSKQELISKIIELTNTSKASARRAIEENSEFTDSPDIQIVEMGGRGNPIGYCWKGESHPDIVDGYEKLKSLVMSGKWSVSNVDALRDAFKLADQGDQQSKDALNAYLGNEKVKETLGI